jgi:hypothetical protein
LCSRDHRKEKGEHAEPPSVERTMESPVGAAGRKPASRDLGWLHGANAASVLGWR